MVSLVQPCDSPLGRQQSRSYYQVLGISPDEQNPSVIEEAALSCSNHVRAYQLTCESECTLRLNEIAQALSTLLDPVRRREYDRGIGMPPGEAILESRLPQQQAASEEGTLRLLVGEGRTCDVKLVYLVRPGACSFEDPGRPFQAAS